MAAVELLLNKEQSPPEQSPQELHDEAMLIAKDLKTQYLRMFEILLKIESRKLYQQFEITNLHTYCVELLELSRFVANDFIIVVRKSLEIPEIADAIREKRVTVSKVRKVCSVITPKEAKEWIDLVAYCSCREVERTVALANPRESVPETMKYVAGNLLKLELGVSEEWAHLLVKTKDLMSQKKCRNVTTEEALFALMYEHNEKNDPVKKAERALKKREEKFVQVQADSKALRTPSSRENKIEIASSDFNAKAILNSNPSEDAERSAERTRYRPKDVEYLVDLRDQNQCTFIDRRGKRCESKRWLDKHHILEFAEGGRHTPENLETLCSGHHKIKHMMGEIEFRH